MCSEGYLEDRFEAGKNKERKLYNNIVKRGTMEATNSTYDFNNSIDRIDEILSSSDASYDGHKGVPSRNNLTFLNGYYVDITILFVDLRGSKELSEKHTRPVLAKIYRAYISEVVAVMKGDPTISEIYIEGDGVWGVFNTTTEKHVQNVFSTSAKISSLVNILNIKLIKRKYTAIKVGIGIDDGTTLYIKAGFKGSGLNEVVWIGKPVGIAAELCKAGNRTTVDNELMVSERVYQMLSDHQKGLLTYNKARGCYHGNVINKQMEKWVNDNG